MKLQLNSLYWPNYNQKMLMAHKKVMDHFGLVVTYCEDQINHGEWMDRIISSSKADVIGFIEPDCIPLTREIVLDSARYALNNESFVGIAQASNHIPPKSHIYAAPAFYFISKKCWEKVKVSYSETQRSDVGEEFCYKAEALGIRYRTYYPNFFEREPVEGVWPLGSFGYYGVGTVFHNSIYHLYQGRMGNNADLYVKRCEQVINKTFSTVGMNSSTTFKYDGRIVD